MFLGFDLYLLACFRILVILDTQCLFTLLLGSVSLRFSVGSHSLSSFQVLGLGKVECPVQREKLLGIRTALAGDLMKVKLVT